MSREAAHAAWWRTFEVVVGVPVAIAIVLQFVAPWSLSSVGLSFVRISIGIALVVAGVTLVARARRELRRHGQPTEPGQPTRQLVSAGVFAFSRNPLYLGGISVLLGLALAFDVPWLIVLLVPSIVACHVLLIVPEERYLRDTFGAVYVAYTEKVARWLGRTK